MLGQSRSTQHRRRKVRADEAALRSDVVRLASRFGRYGYRQITNLLRIEGWRVSSSPLSPCATAHRRISKDHSADECPDAFVIDV